MYIKTDKRDPLFDVHDDDITNIHIIEKQSAEFEFDENNQAKYVDCFSASFTGTEFVTLNNTFGSSNQYTTSGLAYMIQSMFFPNDSIQGNNYITHPWNQQQLKTVHCVSLNHNLFKDKLLGFNYDFIISIAGNVFGSIYLGEAAYDDPNFIYTANAKAGDTLDFSQFFISTETNASIQTLEDLGFDYSIVNAGIYGSGVSYMITGVLFRDYGLIVFFDNKDNWSGWNNARFVNHSDLPSTSGSVQNPTFLFNFVGNTISYKNEQHSMEKNVNVKCDWLNCNYTSNETIYNNDSGEYKFNVVETMEELITLDIHKQPRTYVSKIKLFDDQFNLVAEAVLSKPIKKDFMTNINFNIKVRL